MRFLVHLVLVSLLAIALSGCGDSPPSGEFSSTGSGFTRLSGTAEFEYQEKQRPDGTADLPGDLADQICDNAGPDDPIGQQCQEPATNVTVRFMGVDTLPDPGSETYEVYLVNSSGELRVGSLDASAGGAYELEQRYDANYDGDFDHIEVRLGGVPVAEAGTSGSAANDFSPIQGLTLSFEGEWSGSDLTLTVSGAEPNVTYTAWLVTEGEDGNLSHDESFSVTGNDEFKHTAEQNIGRYDRFHVHLFDSSINVAVAEIDA